MSSQCPKCGGTLIKNAYGRSELFVHCCRCDYSRYESLYAAEQERRTEHWY